VTNSLKASPIGHHQISTMMKTSTMKTSTVFGVLERLSSTSLLGLVVVGIILLRGSG